MRRLLARLAAPLLIVCSALLAGPAGAQAYGGDGSMDVWQIGLSFNCNNRTECGGELGGFWGWAELDHDPATGTNTGDLKGSGCSHGEFNGAVSISVEILNWWVAPGSAGPNTLFTDEVDTTRFRGTTEVETILGEDSGVALVEGHQSGTDVFGFRPPPGIAIQIQIAYKPANNH
jgi:hypothetical protein